MAIHAERQVCRSRPTTVVIWVLAISYLLGALVAAFLESSSQTLSARFDYPPLLIFGTCIVQLICAIGLLHPRFTFRAALLLTVIATGAVASHLKIGSPLTALPALAFVATQVWLMGRLRSD